MAITTIFNAPAKTYKTQDNAMAAYTKFISEYHGLRDAELKITMAVAEDGRFFVITHGGHSSLADGRDIMSFATVFAASGFCITFG